MQKFYEHSAPMQPNVQGARLNLTFRWIKQHSRACACCVKGFVKQVAPALEEDVDGEHRCLRRVQHWAGKASTGAEAWQRAVRVADTAALLYAAEARRCRADVSTERCEVGRGLGAPAAAEAVVKLVRHRSGCGRASRTCVYGTCGGSSSWRLRKWEMG